MPGLPGVTGAGRRTQSADGALAAAKFLPQWVGTAHGAAGEMKDEVEDRHQHKVNEDPRTKALDHHGYGSSADDQRSDTVEKTSSTLLPASRTCFSERLTAAQLVMVNSRMKPAT